MLNQTLHCSRIDLVTLIKDLEEKRDSLREQLLSLNKNLGKLKTLMVKKGAEIQKFKIPISLLTNVQSKKETLKWKKEVLELLQRLDSPVNCQIAYRKLVLYNHFGDAKKKFVMINISAALFYLTENGKILKYKNPYGRGYVYGLIHQFDTKGNLLNKYDSRLKKEVDIDSNKISIKNN